MTIDQNNTFTKAMSAIQMRLLAHRLFSSWDLLTQDFVSSVEFPMLEMKLTGIQVTPKSLPARRAFIFSERIDSISRAELIEFAKIILFHKFLPPAEDQWNFSEFKPIIDPGENEETLLLSTLLTPDNNLIIVGATLKSLI